MSLRKNILLAGLNTIGHVGSTSLCMNQARLLAYGVKKEADTLLVLEDKLNEEKQKERERGIRINAPFYDVSQITPYLYKKEKKPKHQNKKWMDGNKKKKAKISKQSRRNNR